MPRASDWDAMNRNKFEHGFWTLFNFSVRRIMGPVWLVGGGFLTLLSVATFFDPSLSIYIDGFHSSEISTQVLGVFISLFVAVTGWMFLRAPKYCPPTFQEK